MPQKSGIRIQSAMEYLMTYGWAILVISVVLGGMFALGVFNPTTFLAKAQPGACQVIRTNGPNTTMFISTSGLCNGQLPQFIATFSGNGAYANLGNSISESPENGATGAMTLCTWYLVNSLTGYVGVALKGESSPSNGNSWEYTIDPAGTSQGFAVYPPTGTPFLPPSPIASYSTGSQPTTGKWYFACFTYNYAKSSAYYYLNGQQYTATFVGGLPASTGTGNFIVGGGNSGYSQVWMSNVQ
ncbi:MAG: hypothetical protein KGH78_00660, partial [Candidatus Micrarchaeota archaeon]|nr:hypothetical protein [Candidatus Micrarchaeota archaeon]